MKPLLCAAALAVFLAPARAAYLDSNRAVSAESQTNGRGCYPIAKHPQLTDQLVLINRAWAAIDAGTHTPPDADPITHHGTAPLAKNNEGAGISGTHLTDQQHKRAPSPAGGRGEPPGRRPRLLAPAQGRASRDPYRRMDHARRRRRRRPVRRHAPRKPARPGDGHRVLPALAAARERQREQLRVRHSLATAPGREPGPPPHQGDRPDAAPPAKTQGPDDLRRRH